MQHAPPPESPLGRPARIGLDGKVAFLRGLCGPGDEAIETHFAWIILAGERALKLRKPVRRDPMDYGSLAARRAGSELELRLNRRLAPDVYLGVQPLVVDAAGRLAVGGSGEVVDWLVEMRRLDRRRMLDAVLAHGEASEPDLHRVVEMLAAFYASAAPALTEPAAYPARLRNRAQANHAALESLDPDRAALLLARQCTFLESSWPVLEGRVARGCIVEAHGDLRPEHILLDDPAAVIDCLEFDRDLRILDRAEELCFLELECGRLGHAATGRWLREHCLARLADDAPATLLEFYRSLRAANRAKLYTWRADEPDGGTPCEWRARASGYLSTALESATASLA